MYKKRKIIIAISVIVLLICNFTVISYAAISMKTNNSLPDFKIDSMYETSVGVTFDVILRLNRGLEIEEIGIAHYKPDTGEYVTFPCCVSYVEKGIHSVTIPYDWLSTTEEYIFTCYCKLVGKDMVIVNNKKKYAISEKTPPKVDIVKIELIDSKLYVEIVVDSALDNPIEYVNLEYATDINPITTHTRFRDVSSINSSSVIVENIVGYDGRHYMYATLDIPKSLNLAWFRIVAKNQKGKCKSSIYFIENGNCNIGNCLTIAKCWLLWIIGAIITGGFITVGTRIKRVVRS